MDQRSIDRENDENEENIPPTSKRAKTKTPRILDGTFYSIKSVDKGIVCAHCLECGELRKGNISSTGNFISHYKLKHKEKVHILSAYLKSGKLDEKVTQSTIPAHFGPVNKEEVSNIIQSFIISSLTHCFISFVPTLGNSTSN